MPYLTPVVSSYLCVVSSVTQSCPTLYDPMDCSTSGLPVHHQLPELTQTHVHWVHDAIQPSHLCVVTGWRCGGLSIVFSESPLYSYLDCHVDDDFSFCNCLNIHIFFLISPEAMTMGKLHKEIGQLIVQSAEDPEKSDSQVIQVMPSSSHRRGPKKASFGSSTLSAVHVNRVMWLERPMDSCSEEVFRMKMSQSVSRLQEETDTGGWCQNQAVIVEDITASGERGYRFSGHLPIAPVSSMLVARPAVAWRGGWVLSWDLRLLRLSSWTDGHYPPIPPSPLEWKQCWWNV